MGFGVKEAAWTWFSVHNSWWSLEKRMVLSPDKLTSLKALQVYSFLSLVMPVLALKITGVRDSASLDLK